MRREDRQWDYPEDYQCGYDVEDRDPRDPISGPSDVQTGVEEPASTQKRADIRDLTPYCVCCGDKLGRQNPASRLICHPCGNARRYPRPGRRYCRRCGREFQATGPDHRKQLYCPKHQSNT